MKKISWVKRFRIAFIQNLPQTVGGFELGFIFIQYGFFAAILSHFVFNTIMLAKDKRKNFTLADALVGVYYTLVTLFLLSLVFIFSVNVPAIMHSLFVGTLSLANFSLPQIILTALLVGSISQIFAVFFDTPKRGEQIYSWGIDSMSSLTSARTFKRLSWKSLFWVCLGVISVLGDIFFGKLLIGVVYKEIIVICVALTTIMIIRHRSDTGSAIARVGLVNAIETYVLVSILIQVNIFLAVGLLLLSYIVNDVLTKPFQANSKSEDLSENFLRVSVEFNNIENNWYPFNFLS